MTGLPPWAEVGAKRQAHIERVAALMAAWADAAGTPEPERDRWLRAAYLHDALRDADPAWLAELVPESWGTPKLRHGPAAAIIAEREGERDQGVLDAVRYHSVGYEGWDRCGQMLYMADYLEPGRKKRAERRRALAARVPQEMDAMLREVARERVQWTLAVDGVLIPETVAFWNALARSA